MSGDWCKTCRDWVGSFGTHVCPPSWEVHRPDRDSDGDWHIIYAPNAARAAAEHIEATERRDVDFPVASGGETVVVVRSRGDTGPGVRYLVGGRCVPTYHAAVISEALPKKELQRDLVGRRVRLNRILGNREGSLWQAGDELLVTWTNAGLFHLRDFSPEKRVVTDVKRSDFELCEAGGA